MARRQSLRPVGLAAAVAVLALGACVAPNPAAPSRPAIDVPDGIRVGTTRGVVSVPFEDYVLATVLSEVSPVGETPDTVARVFEAQAVVARTWALTHLGRHRADGFDVCDTTHCQVYDPSRIGSSRFSADARRAVERTRGLIVTAAGHPIDALYHADCGGHTASAHDVWGGPGAPYLEGVDDDLPATTHRAWQFDAAETTVRAALDADARSVVGARLDGITVVRRDASGRAAEVEIRGAFVHVLRGEDLRAIINRTFGVRALQSTRFALTRDGATYRFRGTGYGHGVGLCQVGTIARARRGDSLEAILTAYYPGTRLTGARDDGRRVGILEPFPSR